MPGLRIDASANYNYARLTKNNPTADTGLVGSRLPYTPPLTAVLSGDYNWPIGASDTRANVGAAVAFTSRTATDLNDTLSGYRVLRGYSMVSLHVGVTKRDWSLTAAIANLFNDQTIVSYAEVIEGLYPDAYITNRPRTVSLTMAQRF